MAVNLYHWHGIDATGQNQFGTLTSKTKKYARLELCRHGLLVRKIRRVCGRAQKFNPADLAKLSQQISTLLAAGISLIEALNLINQHQTSFPLLCMLNRLKQDISKGQALNESLHLHPQLFSPFACSMIHLGEISGRLALTFSYLADYYGQLISQKQSIYRALSYPAVLTSLSLIIIIGLLSFVVPQFAQLFSQFGANLPPATRCVIEFSWYIRSYGFGFLMLCIATSCGFKYTYHLVPKFKTSIDQLRLQFPYLGVIYQQYLLAHFAHRLALTQAAGLPLLEGLKLLSMISANSFYQQSIEYLRIQIAHGQQLHQAMNDCLLFPPLLRQMVQIGEETGQIDTMLTQISEYYHVHVTAMIAALTRLLEPLLMTLLGIGLGGIVIAMYLPILQLGSLI